MSDQKAEMRSQAARRVWERPEVLRLEAGKAEGNTGTSGADNFVFS